MPMRKGDSDNYVGQPGAKHADHKNDRIEVGKVINISATRMVADQRARQSARRCRQ